VKTGVYNESITHSNVLRTVADLAGVNPPNDAAAAAPITDAWSAVPPGTGPDLTGPTAAVRSAPVLDARNLKYYTFQVRWSDDVAVNPATIDGSDVVVTGPNGFSRAAQLVGVNRLRSGTPRVATYRVKAPGGQRWTPLHNGTYTLKTLAGQVRDTTGNGNSGATIGTFSVAIPVQIGHGPIPAARVFSSVGVTRREGEAVWA
jgi:hypothetical protein